MARKMPAQKPGASEQSVQTDPLFIAAVVERFGPLVIDLAASAENAQAPNYITAEQDSLAQDWEEEGWPSGNRWLNPPFKNIGQWAAKCARYETRAPHAESNPILFLVPAGIGANWYRDHVHGKARVSFLNGRLTFVGHTKPYPKDCMLCVYGRPPGFEVWSWKS